MAKRSLENAGKRERANTAKAANVRERNIAKHYLNAGPNIINLARAAYHWYNSVPWLGGQNENGLILQTGEAPVPGIRNPKSILKGVSAITKANAAKVTPAQWTAAQDAAIARGDMTEAQRLRDLHFKVNAPNTAQREKMYNASGESFFNEFNGGKTGLNWFSESEEYAANHGIPRAFYINEPNIYFGNVPAWVKGTPASEGYIKSLRKLGYTEEQIAQKIQSINKAATNTSSAAKSVGFGKNNELVTKNNNTIKLADAVTYDDKSIRIPLGERDNFKSNDIRYALTPFIVGGTGYGIYNRAKKRNGGSNNIGSYKRSIEDAGRISDEEYYNIMEGEVINKQRNKEKNGGVHYKVKKGDTLSKIAKQYTGNALRYDEIAELSNITNPNRLEIGQDIIIPQKFLDTIKDTNLPELVVTGNKNNRLIDKIKAPIVKHEEKPNTLRVQRLRNRSISLEELNKPSFIESKLQDVKDVISESGNIQDFLQTAWNGIAKNFVEDKKVTTKKRNIKANTNNSKNSTVLDENFAKETRNGTDTLTWDKVPIDRTGNKYYIQESYPITQNMRFGARNRGEYTPLNSNNAPLTTYRPLVKYENNKVGAVDGEGHQNHFYGFDKEGKFKVGPLSKFGPGDTMTQAFYFDIAKVKRDKNGNIVYKEDISNPGRFQPVVEGYDENTYDKNGKLKRGVYKESVITTMSKKRSLDGSYGNVSGGRVLLKCDNETRVVSGSIEHVIQELELMQKNHKGKPVRYYQLDNGSYNRGLRTRNGKNISEQDLRDYDKQNTTSAGGGHFMYIRN